MKRTILIAVSLIFSTLVFAAPVNTASSGLWALPATWSLGRLPINGDTVVIPAGVSVNVDFNLNTALDLFIKIYGNLNLKVGKLDLSQGSIIMLYSSASITNTNGNSSDRISIGGVIKYSGILGTLVGPLSATQYTGAIPGGFSGFVSAPLPVKFVGFSVTRKGNDVLVQWSTSEEINASNYVVERSLDGTSFSAIATVAAVGNTGSVSNYNYTDKSITAAIAYYRIRQVDQNSASRYTAIKTVKLDATALSATISAVQGKLVVNLSQDAKSGVSVRVINLNGQVIAEQKLAGSAGQAVVSTSAKGYYIVSLTSSNGLNVSNQVIL